jgi:hypothetical protein
MIAAVSLACGLRIEMDTISNRLLNDVSVFKTTEGELVSQMREDESRSIRLQERIALQCNAMMERHRASIHGNMLFNQ